MLSQEGLDMGYHKMKSSKIKKKIRGFGQTGWTWETTKEEFAMVEREVSLCFRSYYLGLKCEFGLFICPLKFYWCRLEIAIEDKFQLHRMEDSMY